jgi:hypothetical protein
VRKRSLRPRRSDVEPKADQRSVENIVRELMIMVMVMVVIVIVMRVREKGAERMIRQTVAFTSA